MTQRATPPHIVADHLHSAVIHLLRCVRRTDPQTGLSPARLSILSVLTFAGPRTLGELAAAEQVRPPTMSNLVTSLERERLVRRKVDDEDKRVARITVTARGKRVLERGRRLRLDHLTQRLRRLNRAELSTLESAAAIMERISGEQR